MDRVRGRASGQNSREHIVSFGHWGIFLFFFGAEALHEAGVMGKFCQRFDWAGCGSEFLLPYLEGITTVSCIVCMRP